MRRLTTAEFHARHVRPDTYERVVGAEQTTLIVERDTRIDGRLGDVVVRSGARAVITGLVERTLIVEAGGVAFIEGLIDGRAAVDGAIFVAAGGHLAGRLSGRGEIAAAEPVEAEPVPTQPADAAAPPSNQPAVAPATTGTRVDRAAFVKRFPLLMPAWKINGIEAGPLTLERDCAVSAILSGDLRVRRGVKALVSGIIKGSVIAEPGSVLYLDGIVEGDVRVGGAACVEGIVTGHVRTDATATVCLNALVSGRTAPAAEPKHGARAAGMFGWRQIE